MGALFERAGRHLARFLQRPSPGYVTFSTVSVERLRRCLRPCDVLLVEGNSRIASAIKYLTQSTWSHAALYVGEGDPAGELIEADLEAGVRLVPLETHAPFNTRICRPVGLVPEDAARVLAFMRGSLGKAYDLKNIIDLVRYLVPTPPVPVRFRRRLLALGSGDPTRAICSTLIAQAFQTVRYPILPEIVSGCPEYCLEEIYHIRHHSLFVPRDFDISPFFRIVKPQIEEGFDYRRLRWDDIPAGTDRPLGAGHAARAAGTNAAVPVPGGAAS